MSPFKHNMRTLLKEAERATSIERALKIQAAVIVNKQCQMNRNNADALAFLVPIMKREMEAAGVQPVSM